MKHLLHTAIQAAVEAGKAILKIYASDEFGLELKDDSSPLTLADKAAHELIESDLLKTNIPILSEEGRHEAYALRKSWKQLWIVDPLDGTKEFVKKTGEFTVNIALVEDNYPVLGVVFVPATGVLYYASAGDGAFKVVLPVDWGNRTQVSLADAQRLPLPQQNKSLQIVASVSHLSSETASFVELLKDKYGQADLISVGSSIKICQVAEGSADIYPRLGPTMEWDTAAGQAIAEGAGARFINWHTLQRFDYNRAQLLNSWFVVAGNKIPTHALVEVMQASQL